MTADKDKPYSGLPNLIEPKQERSRARMDALLKAGKHLFSIREYEDVTVADIAVEAGCAVGTVYGRFQNKEALFLAIVHDLLKPAEGHMESLLAILNEGTSPREVAGTMIRMLVAFFRNAEGILGAALRRSSTNPESWTPLREAGGRTAMLVLVAMARALRTEPEAVELRVLFAMQMVYGTLINALLNRPGPIQLADPRLEDELIKAMCSYLEI
ncbi:MAG: TetR/AcrR family transcriptional regulator [Parvibaculaceae bacterium]|nr:TetR/AcrR family transcriptional regulator [Parvibaculaceae bacterium]